MGERGKPDKLVDAKGNLIANFPTHEGSDYNYHNAVIAEKSPVMLTILAEIINQIELDELPIKDRPALYVKIVDLMRELAWEYRSEQR